ncbi:TenA family transcriptional regulator [Algiphilus aromaticivorans]|uniref:TenA family transcriptional regulator n=1 Tax=Algiphilus aromaticivorans TaxID=382454 RepID=UPI0005C264D8|nr:iron-containing redox enzyme family protein [Algiphilus aromaticivorans]
MTLYERLQQQSQAQRDAMRDIPLIRAALDGSITRDAYIAYLTQAYHHVRHTVPLMMSCGAHLGAQRSWVQPLLAEYITEETGHEHWILDDIRACGADADALTATGPNAQTELMVAYAYDGIQRHNPMHFFGMVYVLEGTSTALALGAADGIQKALKLPASAVRYLRSHGAVDQEHIRFFADLVNRVDERADQDAILHAAMRFQDLFSDVFRSIPLEGQRAAA